MKTKIKNILLQLLQSPRKFPVEAAMGLAFFYISVCHTTDINWSSDIGGSTNCVVADILWLFVPLFVLTFWLHKVNRWVYVASGLLFLPLMALNLRPFLWTYGFGFTYVLAAILLLMGVRRMDNQSFAAHALHVTTQLFFGLVISAVLTGAVIVITGSFLYIFGIDEPNRLYEYIFKFIWFVIAPQVCCTLISQDEYVVKEPAKVLRLILNFILSPAVIIYTVILYVYFIKIVVTWDLPKGGVAWMVMGFVTVALVGRLMQYVLNQHYYDWFYRHFTWIAVPPLILYWVGSIYLIRLYSFTESRFYLLIAGILMTLFVFMLLWRRTRKFQLMTIIFAAAIILFTYIPGISAKNVGAVCQKARLQQCIKDLNLVFVKTNESAQPLIINEINRDSVLCEKYSEACSVIEYVRNDMGRDAFVAEYGEWEWNEYDFRYESTNTVAEEEYECANPVYLGEYNIMLPSDDYVLKSEDSILTVERDNKVVLVYPINDVVRQNQQLLNSPDSLCQWHNDSLMLVLSGVYVSTDGNVRTNTYRYLLFRKSK